MVFPGFLGRQKSGSSVECHGCGVESCLVLRADKCVGQQNGEPELVYADEWRTSRALGRH
jgi:hypothetical protein